MLQPSLLYRQAAQRLAQVSFHPKKLVLLHTVSALGCSFLLALASYLFSLEIAATGGLGGLGTRSILSSLQSFLELTVTVALPFWQIGLWFAALKWAKEETPTPRDLFQGFRRFGAVLGLRILRGGLIIALGIAVSYISATVFLMTPFASPYLETMESALGNASSPEQLEALFTPELLASAAQALTPLFILWAVLFALLAVPLYYRLRFADLFVMEGMPAGIALRNSLRSTRKKCLQIFKLDLYFWWYYLLLVLSLMLCSADSLLPLIGISLPFSQDAAYFLFLGLGIVCQTLLLWGFEAQRVTTYALAYRTLGNPSVSTGETADSSYPA